MSAQPDQTWDAVRAELRSRAPELRFRTWLEPLELAGRREDLLYVRAPEHIRSWVGERYLPLVRDAAVAVVGSGAAIELVADDWEPPAERPPAAGAPAERRLNPKFTFEQFVIGGGSRFAHAAALSVAELPGQAYNPLLIHGRPGLGKTHLLHAIGNYVQRYGSGLTVRYATVEEFTGEFVEALRVRRTHDFKQRFRFADVLLIDDVQFLASKERTREELFHTFNALQDAGRQLVLTSDRPPEELVGMEDRLSERFSSGLVVELEPPAHLERRVILEMRARRDGVEVKPEVLDAIAERVTTSVRALEAALIQVVARASLRDEEPTAETVGGLFGFSGPAPGGADIDAAVDTVAAYFGVRRQDILARDRRPAVARARHVAMYVARHASGASSTDVARAMGGRQHSTVLNAERRVERDPSLRKAAEQLLTTLRTGRS